MQIRIEGKETEMAAAVQKLKLVFPVRFVSDFYRNRKKTGVSEYGRTYVTLEDGWEK